MRHMIGRCVVLTEMSSTSSGSDRVRRPRMIALLAGTVALAALWLPPAALAGTYTWSMPGDFTVTGANPDHDHYGATPWT